MKFRGWWMAAALATAALAPELWADLGKARNEPNLEKRSQLALNNAMDQYKTARAAYDKGELDHVATALAEVQESVDLAYESLKATGKDPRRSFKWFKKAEIATQELGRKLESFQREMSFSDRQMVDKVKAEVLRIHEELLFGVMEGRKKK